MNIPQTFSKKIKNKNKNIILMGDFNVDLISYNKKGTYEFLEQLFNHNFTPQITLPNEKKSNTNEQNFCKWTSIKV